ncbi:MAG: hypothetical protein IT565_06310 [Rhodospirillales bacterium]|nr:hypothetical protein [Rhodospirillales bacterium]
MNRDAASFGPGSDQLFAQPPDGRASVPSDPSAPSESRPWRGHRINLRLSVPLPGRRMYVAVVGGFERRDTDRRRKDRSENPMLTLGNFLFILGVGAVFYMAAIFAIFLYSAFLE